MIRTERVDMCFLIEASKGTLIINKVFELGNIPFSREEFLSVFLPNKNGVRYKGNVPLEQILEIWNTAYKMSRAASPSAFDGKVVQIYAKRKHIRKRLAEAMENSACYNLYNNAHGQDDLFNPRTFMKAVYGNHIKSYSEISGQNTWWGRFTPFLKAVYDTQLENKKSYLSTKPIKK